MSDEIKNLSQLFAMSRDAVIGIKDNTIVFANPSAETLFSLREGDAAAAHIPEHILSDSAEHFFATMKHDDTRYDVSVVRKDSLTLLCAYHQPSTPLEGDGNADWSRALRELGSDLFTSRLSIDAVVKNAKSADDQKFRDYAGVLYRSYYRMKRLHDHMLTVCCVARNDLPYTPRVIRLEEMCRGVCDTVSLLIQSLDITLTFEGSEDPAYILADENMLEIMLLNLLANGLLHTRAGDHITITLTRGRQSYVIAVDDDGSGIAPERMRELFGATADGIPDAASGAGLGLAVVRGIAERHGGALIVESRPEQGTSFRLSLPRPSPSDIQTLHQPTPTYRTDGMNAVLTELSVVLDKSFYTQKLFD